MVCLSDDLINVLIDIEVLSFSDGWERSCLKSGVSRRREAVGKRRGEMASLSPPCL